uniref:Uncharacterized protein n=1 Tax=Nelumbo nucifera TaxID=4432 RepID=A0A822ZFL3_NELNU|nr:TPA_asm: hypothetical protein HUJ06_016139 [Nelumbo nucifera]
MNNNTKPSSRKRPKTNDEDDCTVSCKKCRPTSHENISVIHININGFNKHPNASPNGLIKVVDFNRQGRAMEARHREPIAKAHSRHSEKRDEALQEDSQLKYSMSKLEKKFNKLEIYYHNLESGLELQQMGCRVYERISTLLQPYHVKVSFFKNPRSTLFQKSGSKRILNQIQKCTLLRGLTRDEVLNKGTKHFNEEFSQFSDRKMSEIGAMLGEELSMVRATIASILQCGEERMASSSVGLFRHPSLLVFRVDKGMRFIRSSFS